MVLIKSVINVFFVRFIPNDAKKVVFEKYTSLLGSFWVTLEAYWYVLASLICNRVLLTKTWHWGLPCSPTCHQIDYNYNFHHSFHCHISIIVNCVNKHPFYGWMLFLARLLTYTILFFHADWDLSMICLHGKLVECHLRSNPITVANLERRHYKTSKRR